MHFSGCHKAMDSHTLFFTYCEHLFFTRQVKYHLAFVTGLGKGFPGHKPVLVRQFTVQTLERKKVKKKVSHSAFQYQLTPTVGLDSLQDQRKRFQSVREPKAVAALWPREVGNKPDEKQR